MVDTTLNQTGGEHLLSNVTSNHHHHNFNHHQLGPHDIINPKTQLAQMTSDSTSSDVFNNHGNMDSMMKNYFHIAFGDTVLFKGWDLQSTGDVLIACLVFFLLAILYEGLKSFREFLFRREARSGSYRVSLYNPTNGCPDDMVPTSGNLSFNQSEEQSANALVSCSMCSKGHIYQSILHAIQVTISYTLMLGFMTFNSWVCLSIVFGAGLGYLTFCWRKLTYINLTDHCN